MIEIKKIHIDFSWLRRINWPRVKDNAVGGVATGLFTGFSPFAPGTAGSLLGAALWWFLAPATFAGQVRFLIVLFGLGVYAAGEAEQWWGHDHQRIVIDEVFGMCFTLMMVPRNPWLYLAAFVLFRLCDIVKFYPADRAQCLKGGWGVMTDDLLAGLYAGLAMLCLQLVVSTPPQLAALMRWMPHRFILYALVLAACLPFIYRKYFSNYLILVAGILGALAFWHWFPFTFFWQLVWTIAYAVIIWWGAQQVERRWKIDLHQYGADKLVGIWLLLWFIPRIGWVYALAIILLALAYALGPWPTRLVRARWPAWAPLLDDAIAAVYASIVLQTVVLIFWYDEMVLIKYLVLKLMGPL
jgi:phosphatidylglycerophosphatase A